MRLSSILPQAISLPAAANVEVSRLVLDSRQLTAGDVFVALRGTKQDGRQFIPEAIKKQVAAVLVESEGELAWEQNIPVIAIGGLRKILGEIAARFYGHPADHMQVFGVTGTNGKTSTTHFIAQALQQLQTPCGVIGTLGNGMYGALGEPGLTTPDAVTLQAQLSDFYHLGAKAVAMEVSSHSIDQSRINGITFAAGIFTNLTQDHLDYHGTMAAYAAVKKRFMAEYPVSDLIINADDEYGLSWIRELDSSRSVVAYGCKRPDLPDTIPALYAESVQLSLAGIRAHVVSPWGSGELTIPLIGQFNLSNVLAVLALLCIKEVTFARALQIVSKVQAVPGRMQVQGGNGLPLVVVDYSHTPDALQKALQALRKHTKGKLICVFGCGGNRDAAKRPLMAAIAEQEADMVIVTNDNPRHEVPEEIARQIQAGFKARERISVQLDRSKAIEKSIQYATADDCILIAGKGAELYQQIGDIRHPFSDVAEVSRYLKSTVHHGDN
jgi:UDP-N-acetylmuramoyl-L-alanyl-D-glutamate--2,6-diaminopimelate ligase